MIGFQRFARIYLHLPRILLSVCTSLAFLIHLPSSGAQEVDDVFTRLILGNATDVDSAMEAQLHLSRGRLTPFLAPSYTPEFDVMLTAGGLYTWSFERFNPFLERSSFSASIGYSTNQTLIASTRFLLYGRGDRARIWGDWGLRDMPDNYFGVGYDKGRYTEKSDSTTAYHRFWWQFYQRLLLNVREDLFIGPVLDFNKTEATDLNPLMAEDPDVLQTGTDIRNTGIGLTIVFDSRDIGVNAYEGLLFDLSANIYGTYLGGKYRYSKFILDYRQYKRVSRSKRRVLAWQLKFQDTYGNTPWPELAKVGTQFDLRGYLDGRFRDKNTFLAILEYRHMFQRKKENKRGNFDSRWGFVTWIGSGSLSSKSFRFEQWLPNFGAGIRFETQPRMNVRIDWGFGIDGASSFYVGFNEAF